MNCEKCQKETFLPFKCQYCGGYFCSEHRLPENHDCPQIESARTLKEETPPATIQKQQSYEYRVTYAPTSRAVNRIRFSSKEIGHLTIAVLLVIGVGLTWIGLQSILNGDPTILTISVIIFTTSFFAHEMAHKIVAQRKGLWAEFRLTLIGAVLTMLSIVSPIIKIISPGAVMVSGYADTESIGRISVAGPMTNITLSAVFLAITYLVPQNTLMALILMVSSAFNAWIALFNLIPFGVFDGFKVFLWNKKIWVLTFSTSLALTAISYIL
jgi:Zn-dependent protease